MITKEKYSRSQRHLINETALSFTENYQGVNKHGDPIYDVVYVGIVSNADIMVFDKNNGIDYGNDLQYQRWRLSGATTGLVSSDAHNIYARLNKQGSKEATIIFSVRNYNTDGSITKLDADGSPAKDEEGNTLYELEASDTYWYILIGTLTELSDTGRTLTFDPGNLSTQYQQNEQGGGWVAEMFELVRDVENLIRAKLRFEKLQVKGESIFQGIASFLGGFKLGPADHAKEITSVATDTTTAEDTSTAIATPAYVTAFSEGRYLNKATDQAQSVSGPVTFEQDVTVERDQAVEGNQTIGGIQTIEGGIEIPDNGENDGVAIKVGDYSDAAGRIRGAQLTKSGVLTVSGLRAMSFEIFELIYNRIRAQGGKYVFSPAANIDKCIYVMKDGRKLSPDEYYDTAGHAISAIDHVLLTLRDDEATRGLVEFRNADILYGYVNSIGDSGQYAVGGECVMSVISTNEEITAKGNMTIKCALFAVGTKTGLVSNMPPTDGMAIAQRGNIQPGVEGNENRLCSFFIDTETANIIMLQNVSTPTVTMANYGVVIGAMPADLFDLVKQYFLVRPTDPIVYARYGIFENILKLDYQGIPIPEERNRGQWNEGIANDDIAENRYRYTPTLYDVVTHNGCLWKCVSDRTTNPPSTDNSSWIKLVDSGLSAREYQLLPSVNVIYLRQDGALSTEALDVAVGETDGHDYTKITSEAGLAARNLKVQYAIDGIGERHDLAISDAAIFELEDGSGVLVSESDAEVPLMMEGEELDVNLIHDHIALYLVNTLTGEDITQYVVPVIKDGHDGKGGRFKSIVFTRSYGDLSKTQVTGGSYTNPFPNNTGIAWSDGIPEGTGPLWSTSHIFSPEEDGSIDVEWSAPVVMTDTPDMEILYTNITSYTDLNKIRLYPEKGSDGSLLNEDKFKNQGWYDNPTNSNNIYMAVTYRVNGVWQDWVFSRIKGEKGDPGNDGKDGTNGADGQDGADGKDGADSYSIELSVSNIPLVFDMRSSTSGQALEALSQTVYVYLLQGGKRISVDNFTCSVSKSETNPVVSSVNPNTSEKRWEFTVTSDKEATYISYSTQLVITITGLGADAGKTFVSSISISKQQRGTVGPKGELGPMPVASGTYDETKDYYLIKDGDGVVTGRPFVWYETSAGNGQYWIVKLTATNGYAPAGTISNSTYWEAFDMYDAVYAKLLMANWANLAQFVFYSRFMFSETGTSLAGSRNVNYNTVFEDMFNKDTAGNILSWSGKFIPKTFIDAKEGTIACGKMIEQFDYFPNYATIYNIDLDKCHNLYIPFHKRTGYSTSYYVSKSNAYPNYTGGVYGLRYGRFKVAKGGLGNGTPTSEEYWYKYGVQQGSPRIVTLPSYPESFNAKKSDLIWLEDGVHVCISSEISSYAYDATSEIGSNVRVSPVIVFPDDTMFSSNGLKVYESGGAYALRDFDQKSYFIWQGLKVSAVLLQPGTMLKLRSSHITIDDERQARKHIRLWYVENASDFDITAMNLIFNTDLSNFNAKEWTYALDPDGWRDYGNVVIGSCLSNKVFKDSSQIVGTASSYETYAHEVRYKEKVKTSVFNMFDDSTYADENTINTYEITFTGANVNNGTLNYSGITAYASDSSKYTMLENREDGTNVTFQKNWN